MGCKAVKLRSSTIKGSTFNGRTFTFLNRDISNDIFIIKYKDLVINGIIDNSTVYFPFTAFESFKSGVYVLEYWADLDGIGNKIIAIEDFYITIDINDQCYCNDENNITLDFSDEIIEFDVSYSVVNITNGIPIPGPKGDKGDTGIQGPKGDDGITPDKGYKELIGYVSQINDNNPIFTLIFSDFTDLPQFTRVNIGEFLLTIPNVSFNESKIFYAPAYNYTNTFNPPYGIIEVGLYVQEITNTYIRLYSIANTFTSIGSPNDGFEKMPFNLKIYN